MTEKQKLIIKDLREGMQEVRSFAYSEKRKVIHENYQLKKSNKK